MNEISQPVNQEITPQEKKLWGDLVVAKQNTDNARRDSKALNVFAGLTNISETIVYGKGSPILNLVGIITIVSIPYFLDKSNNPVWARVSSDVISGIGFSAVAERELPFMSGSEKAITKWVDKRVLNTKKTRINGEDIARVLVNFPKALPKGPNEIRERLMEDDTVKKEKDPYIFVAKSVRGLIVEEHVREDGSLNIEQKEKEEIDETVLLMLEGQIKAQEKMKTPKYIRKECVRITADVIGGALVGVLISELSTHFFGSQYGGAFGLIDDVIILKKRIDKGLAKSKNTFIKGIDKVKSKAKDTKT